MAKIDEIKLYFKKLQKLIAEECVFTFFSWKLIEKNKVDDILCCILASFPDNYKAIMKTSRKSKFRSMMSYHVLQSVLRQRFKLNSDMYIFKYNDALNIIGSILNTIEKDMNFLENEYK